MSIGKGMIERTIIGSQRTTFKTRVLNAMEMQLHS